LVDRLDGLMEELQSGYLKNRKRNRKE